MDQHHATFGDSRTFLPDNRNLSFRQHYAVDKDIYYYSLSAELLPHYLNQIHEYEIGRPCPMTNSLTRD